jgi:hypothetical protein
MLWPLNALVKIQTSDTINEKGKKSILFSRYPDFISSFQFNRQTLFDSIVRQQLEVIIDKPAALAAGHGSCTAAGHSFFESPLRLL